MGVANRQNTGAKPVGLLVAITIRIWPRDTRLVSEDVGRFDQHARALPAGQAARWADRDRDLAVLVEAFDDRYRFEWCPAFGEVGCFEVEDHADARNMVPVPVASARFACRIVWRPKNTP